MKIEKDRAEVTSGVRHGRTPGQPGGAANREPRLPELGGADEPLAGGRRGGRGAPASPGPRRPRRDPEVRLHSDVRNVLERASARETAARVAAGRWPRPSCASWARAMFSHVTGIGSISAPERHDSPRRTSTIGGRVARARLDPDASQAMVAEIDAPQGQRVARGHVRGERLRARARDRLAHLLGGAPRRPAGRGDHVDPGHEGRGHRGRLRPGRARRARRPTTRSSSPTSAATTARPTAPAGSRAG